MLGEEQYAVTYQIDQNPAGKLDQTLRVVPATLIPTKVCTQCSHCYDQAQGLLSHVEGWAMEKGMVLTFEINVGQNVFRQHADLLDGSG